MESTPNLLNMCVEAIARLTSYALTDKEKESVVNGFHKFHARLERMNSSSSLRQLAIESQNSHGQVSRCQHEGMSCTQNAIRGLLRTFLIGFGVKCGLEAVPHIITLRAFTRPSLLLTGFSRDTASFASFLAVLISSYKAILCGMRRVRGTRRSDYTNAMVAGLLAGLVSAKLDRSQSRRSAIALYLFSRALQYGTVWVFERWAAHKQAEEDKIRSRGMRRAYSVNVVGAGRRRRGENEAVEMANPEPQLNWGSSEWMSEPKTADWKPGSNKISWGPEVADSGAEASAKREKQRSGITRSIIHYARKYAPAGVMVVSTTVITYVLAFHTDSIPRGYTQLLVKGGGLDSLYPNKAALVYKSLAETLSGSVDGKLSIPAGMPTKQMLAQLPYGSDLAKAFSDHIHHDSLGCGLFHPHTTSCTHGAVSAFLRGFPFAMRMYVPLNVMMKLIFQGGQLAKDPLSVLRKIIKSSMRSSLFFSLMTTSVMQVPCAVRALLGRETKMAYVVAGIVGGLAVLVEAQPRHIELGMYCFLRAMLMAWDVGLKKGLWRSVRHGEVALLSVSMGVLMSIFQNDPTTFSLTYRSIVTRVFGKN
ncbi:hypothetical protein IWW50_005575 [Coemansia erecta]|nr:hypothetical protein IWW50_005575 [Coemansia erecta]